jgi:hypothetical protein
MQDRNALIALTKIDNRRGQMKKTQKMHRLVVLGAVLFCAPPMLNAGVDTAYTTNEEDTGAAPFAAFEQSHRPLTLWPLGQQPTKEEEPWTEHQTDKINIKSAQPSLICLIIPLPGICTPPPEGGG